jgi:hypothetical protein
MPSDPEIRLQRFSLRSFAVVPSELIQHMSGFSAMKLVVLARGPGFHAISWISVF